MSRKRYSSRFEKRKQNRFLNIAIAVVVVLILIMAGSLVFGGKKNQEASNSTDTANSSSQNESSNQQSSSQQSSASSNNDTSANNTSSSSSTGNTADSTKSSDSQKSSAAKPKTTPSKPADVKVSPQGGGPQGPWNPIGTSQTEPHQKSYDANSTDWKEQTEALSYATSIPSNQMTILWLGNGGAPDRSVGRVLSKADGKKYEVQLQWITGKGWKPTSVSPM